MHRFRLPSFMIAALSALAVAPAAQAADPAPPAATTVSARSITQSTVTLNATVDPNRAATTYEFQYGTSSSYGLTTPAKDAGDGDAAVAVSADVAGLTEYTRYHYRVVATNAAGITRGADRTFTTARKAKAPTLGTFSARSITATGATPRGSVNAQGLATTVHLEYGLTTAYGTSTADTALPASFSSKTVNIALAGLAPYTRYHYRAVATNAAGVTRGPDRTVTTLRAPTQVVLEPIVSELGWGGTATIKGRVLGAGTTNIGVSVERSDFPFSSTWTPRNVTTGSDGSFSTTVGPLYSAVRLRVRTRAPYDVASPWSTVANRVSVAVKTTAKTRRSVTITGRIFPLLPKGVAILQRVSSKGTWARAGRVSVTAGGRVSSRYRFTITRPKTTRTYRVLVVPHDAGAHATGTSREIAVARRR
jgi:hypothetical protein